jgi:hypothetical protein
MTIEYNSYVRKPFRVEAIEITEDNIAEIAPLIGELREKDDTSKTKFIYVDRRLVPNIWRVYPGFFMTKMGDNIRCYSRRVFLEQFVLADNSVNEWCDYIESIGQKDASQ